MLLILLVPNLFRFMLVLLFWLLVLRVGEVAMLLLLGLLLLFMMLLLLLRCLAVGVVDVFVFFWC